MTRGNADVVRELFDAVAREDNERVLALYDPDVEWDGARSRWSEVMPAPTACWRGHDALREFFRSYYEMWDNLEHGSSGFASLEEAEAGT